MFTLEENWDVELQKHTVFIITSYYLATKLSLKGTDRTTPL